MRCRVRGDLMPSDSLLRKILTVVGFLLAFAVAMLLAVGNATSAPLAVRSASLHGPGGSGALAPGHEQYPRLRSVYAGP